MNNIKLITFDLDDTFWDIGPVIIKAEKETRAWLHEKVGEIQWGSMSDFLEYRKELIEKDPSLEWDISLLRREIYNKKLKGIVSDENERKNIIDEAYKMFLEKRHAVTFYDGVYDSIKKLSSSYSLGVLTNGNADIFKFEIGQFFNFSINSKDVKDNKPNMPHFTKAIEEHGSISFKEVLHIGDHQINDVYGAQQLGIKPIWFNRKNDEWKLDTDQPETLYNWEDSVDLIEKINESK